ncbi:hypothetical protein DB299_05340 (plasmid) [Borreliella bavariensis PBi]|uniref:Uncharacterized protein n=1 Tax=Borrelia garinii subsp. bavariensis (strain ATCC BAA-2496 / DSM 23469 / PBi) TaxID=290434 RepID=A0ABN5RFI1_BORGP|nr:hypothetical protein DB299_05340 [Borreliella bavariensis PBi]
MLLNAIFYLLLLNNIYKIKKIKYYIYKVEIYLPTVPNTPINPLQIRLGVGTSFLLKIKTFNV